MIVSEIELFEALSQQLGADKARTLVKYVATKDDIAKLDVKISETKSRIT